jgi:outer membrane immunogenic protein
MRTNNLLTSTALTTSAVLASGAAFAQPVTYNWTGWYIGINAGGSSTAIDHDVAVPAIGAIGSRLFAFDGRDGSFTGGFQAGYNWQFAPNWFAGIEGDINYLRGSRDNNFRFIISAGEDVVGAVNTRLRWLSTVRGRLGYTWANTMVYATGGVAFGGVRSNVDATRIDTGVVAATFAGSYSETRTGWAVGGGLEQAVTNWVSLRIEYLHFDLGSFSYDVTRVSGVAHPSVPNTWLASGQVSGDIVRVGLNVKLSGP